MLNIYEFDEVLGDCILRDNSLTKEEYIRNNAYDDEDEKELSKEWDLVQEKYNEYLYNYEEEIGFDLDYNYGKRVTCRFCGHKQEIGCEDWFYPDYEDVYDCDNCGKENKYVVEMDHEYDEEYTIKVIRPKCEKRGDHFWIKQKDKHNSNHYYEMSTYFNKFPHHNAVKYTCIKCGESVYIPVDENGVEFSKRKIKKLNRKNKKGYSKNKFKIDVEYIGGFDSSTVEIWGENRDLLEDKINRIMSDFRKGLKYHYTYNKNMERFVFDMPFPCTEKKFQVPIKPCSYLLYFDTPTNYKEKLFIKMLIRRLTKSMSKYGVTFTKEKKEEKIFKYTHELINKEVVVRGGDRGKIIFRGLVVGYDGHCDFKIKSKYQDKYIIVNKRRVELITSNISKVKIKDDVRIERAVRCLEKFSDEWEFIKANRVKTYLNRIGYSK